MSLQVYTVLYRRQRETKGTGEENQHEELYQPCHHRLYCEPTSCDCPAAAGVDVPAYTAQPGGDVTSCRTCYARWPPEVGGGDAEHAQYEPAGGSVLTLRCLDGGGAGRCACHVMDVDHVDATQLDLLRHHDVNASVI